MLVVLNARQARRVAAVTTAASDDGARPILTGINLEWTAEGTNGEPSVTLVATDSYRLIAYEVDTRIDTDNSPLRFGAVATESDGTTLVRASQFANLMERAAKHATIPAKDGYVLVHAEDGGPVLILASHPDKGEVEIGKCDTIDGEFPQWKRLVPELKARQASEFGDVGRVAVATAVSKALDGILAEAEADDVNQALETEILAALDRNNLVMVPKDTFQVVGYNSEMLGELFLAFKAGMAPSDKRVNTVPVVLQQDGMRPTLLTSNRSDDTWTGLLMPVRT